MSPRIAGFDLSISHSGLALPDGRTYAYTPHERDRAGRLHELHSRICARLDLYHVRQRIDVAVIEDYMKAVTNVATTYRLAELRGVIVQALYVRAIPFVEVHPSTLKAFAGKVIGRTVASKDDMVSAALTLGYKPTSDDEADAALLHAIGRQRYEPRDDWPMLSPTVLGLRWPELEVVA